MYKIVKMYIMTRTITATELKVKTAEVINDVAYKRNVVVVEKHGTPLLKMVPFPSSIDLEKNLDMYFGISPNFPKVKRYRTRRPVVKFD